MIYYVHYRYVLKLGEKIQCATYCRDRRPLTVDVLYVQYWLFDLEEVGSIFLKLQTDWDSPHFINEASSDTVT